MKGHGAVVFSREHRGGNQHELFGLARRFIFLKEEYDTMYMVTVDKNKCDGDGTCVNVCPQSVFKLDGGKAEPVNMSECINCLTCVENCPQQAITVTEI
jgi:NAD-dependent dihydropyrimidine dehydrogenase PreA subunit